jgi:hypothetical protein
LQAAVNDRRNLRVKQIHQAHHEIEKEKREAVELELRRFEAL